MLEKAAVPLPRKRAGMVRVARTGVQAISLAVFLYIFIAAVPPGGPLGSASLFYRFDPLAGLAAMLAGRVLIAGFALSAVTILLMLVFGRVWCGWLCPMGTTLDLLRPPRKQAGGRQAGPRWKIPERLRAVKYLLLAALLFLAALGSLALAGLDPLTILTRTLANAAWPALRAAVIGVEGFLYQFDAFWGPLDIVHAAVIAPIFGEVQPLSYTAAPIFLFFIGLAALNWAAERFWCRYLCPLGGLLGLVSRFSLLRHTAGERCSGCAQCARACPTGILSVENGFSADPAECTVCGNCLESCSRGAASFRWNLPRWKAAGRQMYDPARREAFAALGGAAAAAAFAGVEPFRKRQPVAMIRPPGATQAALDALCIRCSQCVRTCPTQGLQASFLEGGWQNMLTPRLEPRLGACSFNCNACGQVCPTGAIPNLSLEEKRMTPVGLARVDRSRCLPWAYAIDCIVCEEACPVADKAIHLEVVEAQNGRGETVSIQRPYVIRELCTGCGMCEYQCPMGGEAAVRVFALTEAGEFLGGGSFE